MDMQVLTVSSKGQISLPVSIRKMLSIDTGDKLVAYASGDAIMLKTLKMPTVQELEKSLDEAQKWAASVGYEESDVNDIIKSVRKRRTIDENRIQYEKGAYHGTDHEKRRPQGADLGSVRHLCDGRSDVRGRGKNERAESGDGGAL